MSKKPVPPEGQSSKPTAGESESNEADYSQVFPLTTLRDIFNLPTFEQMSTCLDELKECMTQARATNDLMVSLAAERGISVDQSFEWPEVLEWKDDGKGEVGTTYTRPDGKELFSMEIKRISANAELRDRQ